MNALQVCDKPILKVLINIMMFFILQDHKPGSRNSHNSNHKTDYKDCCPGDKTGNSNVADESFIKPDIKFPVNLPQTGLFSIIAVFAIIFSAFVMVISVTDYAHAEEIIDGSEMKRLLAPPDAGTLN